MQELGHIIVPVILSGGMGKRLWPLSRENHPKQFLPLADTSLSLIQQTVLRVQDRSRFTSPIILCNEAHRFLASEQLEAIDVHDATYLLEPCSRNTAPAITLAALHVMARYGDAAHMLILPSDHIIRDEAALKEAVMKASDVAANDYLVTFGIETAHAETGYGYIKSGSPITATDGYEVANFIEKPDRTTAEGYVTNPHYYWNSGMFLFPVRRLCEELNGHHPAMFDTLMHTYQDKHYDHPFIRIDEKSFMKAENISIDYALMEVTEHAAMIPTECGWSDAGSWETLWREEEQKDDHGNVSKGDNILRDCQNCHIISLDGPPIVAMGMKDTILVSTRDCVLSAHMHSSQDIKALVSDVQTYMPTLVSDHRKVSRPWGSYDSIDIGPRHRVKRITVNPGASSSLQLHHHRAEHWVVVSGAALVTRDHRTETFTETQSVFIPCGTRHRFKNPGKIPLELIEVQSGSYLEEDDIVRFDDHYGRVEAA